MIPPKNSSGIAVNYTFFVFYLAALSAFGSFVNDMYLPSLPSMTHFFHCSVSMVQLGLTMGMIGLGVGEIVLGPVSDKYGRKSVLAISIAFFCIAAVVSVFSPTIHFFVICRLFQGFGASACYFLARAIPADVYGGRALAKTMAVIGAINGVAPASAPVLGGLIADRWHWQGVFVVLAFYSVLLLLFLPRLKETLPVERRSKLSVLATFRNYGVLLRNKKFMVYVLLKGSALGVLFAYISSAPFIIQTHFGYSKLAFGLFMGANAISVVGGSLVALRFKTLTRAAVIGAAILAVSVVAQMVILWSGRSFWGYEVAMWPILFALGMLFTSSNTLAMNEGRADAGGASAMLGIGGYIFGAIVSPLVGEGNIMHSSAISLGVIMLVVVLGAALSYKCIVHK